MAFDQQENQEAATRGGNVGYSWIDIPTEFLSQSIINSINSINSININSINSININSINSIISDECATRLMYTCMQYTIITFFFTIITAQINLHGKQRVWCHNTANEYHVTRA